MISSCSRAYFSKTYPKVAGEDIDQETRNVGFYDSLCNLMGLFIVCEPPLTLYLKSLKYISNRSSCPLLNVKVILSALVLS